LSFVIRGLLLVVSSKPFYMQPIRVLRLTCFSPVFIFLSLVLRSSPVQAKEFDFNERCKNAYAEIFSLRLEQGKKLLTEEKNEHPENLIPLLLESYLDLLKVITTDNEALLPQFKANKNNRSELLKKGNPASPWSRYAQAEVLLHYALAAFQYQEYWQGLLDMRRAYFLLEENIRLYPDFKPARKSFYTVQALLGAVPEKYQWGLRLLGLSGNLERGIAGLKNLVAENWGKESFLKDEAWHIYILLLFHLEGEKNKAWEEVKRAGYPRNSNLFSYYTAMRMALYSNHNEEALSLLGSMPGGNTYAQFPLLDYYAGIAKLNKLAPVAARSDFQKYLLERTGMNFIKSANQKIAWSYLLERDSVNYLKYMKTAAESGVAQTEADKQAQKEADDGLIPHPEILKARLLFDGGYFTEALKILEAVNAANLQKKDALELVYRKARTLHESGDTVRAVESYMTALSRGRHEPYYFAASSALNLGMIYELRGNKELAKKYFKECLESGGYEYKASLAQKAKSGLERLK